MPEWWEGSYEQRMARRAARRGPEFQARLDERARIKRYREVWAVIVWERQERLFIPHHVRIRQAPRIRGCGAAAKRAGF